MRILREELYGPVGTFFRKIDTVIYRIAAVHMGERTREQDERLIAEIERRGRHTQYTSKGHLVETEQGTSHKHKGVYVPERLIENVSCAIDDEEKRYLGKVDEDSLPVLGYVAHRTRELRATYGNNWYPRFTETEVARRLGWEKKTIESAAQDLLGVFAESHQLGDGFSYKRYYFLPACRFLLANQLLDEDVF